MTSTVTQSSSVESALLPASIARPYKLSPRHFTLDTTPSNLPLPCCCLLLRIQLL